MDRRKIVKFVIIFVLIIAVLCVAEIGIKALVSGIKDVSEEKKQEKVQEEIYNSDQVKKKRNVETFVNDILDAIKDKDYDYVFNFLDEVYSEYMFSGEKENMIKYLEDTFSGLSNAQITNVVNYNGIYEVWVGVDSSGHYDTKYINVKTFDDKYSILFEEYTNIKRENMHYTYENLEYNVKYSYGAQNTLIYVIDFTNKDTKNFNANIKEITAISYGGDRIVGTGADKLEIAPGATQRMELSFVNDYVGISMLTIKTDKKDINIFFSNYMDV